MLSKDTSRRQKSKRYPELHAVRGINQNMSDFSDKEDRMLIQLVHQHYIAKGKRPSWINIAAKMKTKKTPNQLRLRVACLKKRFGNVLASFPPWYFMTTKPKSHNRNKSERGVATVRIVTTVRSVTTIKAHSVGEVASVQQSVQKVS
jgi:hypothetical protein